MKKVKSNVKSWDVNAYDKDADFVSRLGLGVVDLLKSLPDDEKLKGLTSYIRFFEFEIEKKEAKFKFNQNKSKDDIQSVIKGLHHLGKSEVAEFMKRQN